MRKPLPHTNAEHLTATLVCLARVDARRAVTDYAADALNEANAYAVRGEYALARFMLDSAARERLTTPRLLPA